MSRTTRFGSLDKYISVDLGAFAALALIPQMSRQPRNGLIYVRCILGLSLADAIKRKVRTEKPV